MEFRARNLAEAISQQIQDQMAGKMNRHFPGKVQMANKYMQMCSALLPLNEMLIQTTLAFPFTPERMIGFKKLKKNAGDAEGKNT